jgi:hypothetical protein
MEFIVVRGRGLGTIARRFGGLRAADQDKYRHLKKKDKISIFGGGGFKKKKKKTKGGWRD